MANRVMTAPGCVWASHQHVCRHGAAPEDRGEPRAVQGGEAERDGEVGDEEQREHAVGAAADLVQGLCGGWGHRPICRPISEFP